MNTLVPTDAEQKLIEAARNGLPADLGSANEAENDPANGDGWGPARTIRAEIIYALATGARADWPVHPKGIQLYGARIEGQFDFSDAELRCRLILKHCSIEKQIIFDDSTTRSIELTGSVIAGIVANRMAVRGSFVLQKVRAVGEVKILGAKISGQFDCAQARFSNRNGPALIADGTSIEGGAFLNEGFAAIGMVRFGGARIANQLNCRDGHFRSNAERAPALALDGLKADRLLLDLGFKAIGEVRLLGAEIRSQLSCRCGSFQNPTGFALSADGATINGHVFLDEKFESVGEVRFIGARMLKDISCEGGKFDHLNLQRAQVSGILFMRGLTDAAQSRIDLTHARIGQLADDQASWPAKGNFHIDGFEYDAIVEGSPRDAKSRLEWLDRAPEKGFSTQPYEQLEKVLRASGDERGAVEVYIAKRRAIREKGQMSRPARAWDRTLDCAVGYGYRVGRICLPASVIVLLGSVLFWLWFYSGQPPSVITPTVVSSFQNATTAHAGDVIHTKPPAHPVRECANHALHSFFYSLEVFLPFDGTPWRSSPPLYSRHPDDLWFYAIEAWCVIEELLGWLAAGLIAAAAAGVIQK